jgi:hypothetical protein
MANNSLREYSALTPDNIRTGPIVAVGDAAFELKPALINMVQASQICGKSYENANTTRKVAICDDLLVTLLTFVTEWYVLYDEFSNFVIGGK